VSYSPGGPLPTHTLSACSGVLALASTRSVPAFKVGWLNNSALLPRFHCPLFCFPAAPRRCTLFKGAQWTRAAVQERRREEKESGRGQQQQQQQQQQQSDSKPCKRCHPLARDDVFRIYKYIHVLGIIGRFSGCRFVELPSANTAFPSPFLLSFLILPPPPSRPLQFFTKEDT